MDRVTTTAGQGSGARPERSRNAAAVTLSGQDPWPWGDAGTLSRRKLPLPALHRRNVMLLHLNRCQRDSGGTRQLHLEEPACQLWAERLPQWKKQPCCLRKGVKVRISTASLAFPLCSVLGVGPSPPSPEISVGWRQRTTLWNEDKDFAAEGV